MHHVALFMASFLVFPMQKPSAVVFLAVLLLLLSWSIAFSAASWDYEGYLRYYECAVSARCDVSSNIQVETSFALIAETVASIFGSEGGVVVISIYSGTAIIVKLFVFRDKCDYFGIAVFGYLAFGFFLHDMTQIRAGLSIGLLWLAYSDLSEPGRRWRMVLWFLLAVAFHNSAVIAILVPLTRVVRLNPTRAILLFLGAIGLGRLLNSATEMLLDSIPGGADARLVAYAAAGQNAVLAVAQLPIFALLVGGLVVILLLVADENELTGFELICLRSTFWGLILYLLIYWIPVIGIRSFELLASPLPIIAAAVYRASHRPFARLATIMAMSALFANAMVRNGLMRDLVLDGQAQQSRLFEQ
jgi:hypothetical protein